MTTNDNMQDLIIEKKCLRDEPLAKDAERGIGIDSFKADCNGDAEKVLKKAVELMNIVNSKALENNTWPSDDEWRRILPKWFIDKCGRELTSDEFEARAVWFQKLSSEEKAKVNKESQWELSGWIFWFRPEERSWFWWDSEIDSKNEITIDIRVLEWPYPWGSLRWLMKACGATNIENVD